MTIPIIPAGSPKYYPKYLKTPVGAFLGLAPGGATDTVTSSLADAPFSVNLDGMEHFQTSYFTSMRSGVQGLGFVQAAWDGLKMHCGYDSDCIAPPPLGSKIQISSQAALVAAGSCADKVGTGNCAPLMLEQAVNGVPFGVSSFRALPSGNFLEIPETSGGDGAMWDYNTFTKTGTSWPGLNKAFFFLYDIALSQEIKFLNLDSHQWAFSSFQLRKESCGGGGDAKGIDCDSPAGTVNVGSAFSAARPLPLYVSMPELATTGLTIKTCADLSSTLQECQRPLKEPFELYSSRLSGQRLCYRESWQINVKMDVMVPLLWQTEHFCISGLSWQALVQTSDYDMNMEDYLAITIIDLVAHFGCVCFMFYKAFTYKNVDNSSDFSDRCCN
jgi:hypothetical protein